jgi:hypothetical protein
VAIAAARISAVAEIVAVTVVAIAVATVVAADVGDAVADASAAAVGALRVPADAICLPPNMLRRKVASRAETIRVVTTTVARTTAASEARKIAAARHAVSNPVDRRSAALTIARLKLPVPPHPELSRKNLFFFPASL